MVSKGYQINFIHFLFSFILFSDRLRRKHDKLPLTIYFENKIIKKCKFDLLAGRKNQKFCFFFSQNTEKVKGLDNVKHFFFLNIKPSVFELVSLVLYV